jgi:hypothetical protein
MNKFTCDYCQKEFSTKGNLKLHQKTAKYCLNLRNKEIEENNKEHLVSFQCQYRFRELQAHCLKWLSRHAAGTIDHVANRHCASFRVEEFDRCWLRLRLRRRGYRLRIALIVDEFHLPKDARVSMACNEPWTSVFEASGCLIENDPELQSYYAAMRDQRRRRSLARKQPKLLAV